MDKICLISVYGFVSLLFDMNINYFFISLNCERFSGMCWYIFSIKFLFC